MADIQMLEDQPIFSLEKINFLMSDPSLLQA
jgi:hypothetical protein